ncbi:MAG: type III pantothenate kinase [Bacteroidales bacterium]|nr:type III pantothenate kinase [Bacteroidales bacterium]
MNLVIDFGNTRCKFYFFDGGRLTDTKIFEHNASDFIEKVLTIVNKSKIDNAIVSSVGNIPEKLTSLLSERYSIITLNSSTSVPISNSYSNPSQLGNDRLAAAVGASVMFPNRDCLVVDAGTAITYEFIEGGKKYLGGCISPGLSLRFAALHEHTAKLPLLQPKPISDNIPTDTQNAINNGVINGVIAEIMWQISYAQQKLNNPALILTGGDTFFLAEKLKNTIFAEPNLVAIGLNRILEYNVKQN